VQHKDASSSIEIQTIEKMQIQSPQHISSMAKVEDAMGRETTKVEERKEENLQEV
jgi:hypothetical protein